MRALLIEDDAATPRTLTQALQAHGAKVDRIDSGEDAIDMLRHYDYDIVLLDQVVSDLDGYEVIRRMRSAGLDTPILILSSAVRPQARVRAFGMGADDFITRPYDLEELVARMQAIVRRSKGYSQPMIRIGEIQLNLETHEVLASGRPVHLTGKEYAILELLVLRKGMVLTKEVFLNHLYGGLDEPEVKIIDVFICKLRKKLADAGANSVIGTVWGRGYTVRDPAQAMLAATPPRPAPPAPFAGPSPLTLRHATQAA